MKFAPQRYFLLLALSSFIACSHGGGSGGSSAGPNAPSSVLEGEIPFAGPLPPVVNVSYTTLNGYPIGVFAHQGLVTILTNGATSLQTVQDSLTLAGGTIKAAIPAAGIFIASVPPGDEDTFLATIFLESWVRTASPTMPLANAEMALLDDFTLGPFISCGHPHGANVQAVMEHGGESAQPIELSAGPGAESLASQLAHQMEAYYTAGEHAVFNMSLQSYESFLGDGANARVLCATSPNADACKKVQEGQLQFMAPLLQTLEASDLAIQNNTILVISSGNAGVDISNTLLALGALYPNACRRLVVVGGADTSGMVSEYFNFASSMTYARGFDVPTMPGMTCSGTSFAAPEVTRVLDEVWRALPSLSADDLIFALELLLAELGNPVLPYDPATGMTEQSFIQLLIEKAQSLIDSNGTGCPSMFDGIWTGTFGNASDPAGNFTITLTFSCHFGGTTGSWEDVLHASTSHPMFACGGGCTPPQAVANLHFPTASPHISDGLAVWFPNGSMIGAGTFNLLSPGGVITVSSNGNTITGTSWDSLLPSSGLSYQGGSWTLTRNP